MTPEEWSAAIAKRCPTPEALKHWTQVRADVDAYRELARTFNVYVVVPTAPPVTFVQPSSKDGIVDDFSLLRSP